MTNLSECAFCLEVVKPKDIWYIDSSKEGFKELKHLTKQAGYGYCDWPICKRCIKIVKKFHENMLI